MSKYSVYIYSTKKDSDKALSLASFLTNNGITCYGNFIKEKTNIYYISLKKIKYVIDIILILYSNNSPKSPFTWKLRSIANKHDKILIDEFVTEYAFKHEFQYNILKRILRIYETLDKCEIYSKEFNNLIDNEIISNKETISNNLLVHSMENKNNETIGSSVSSLIGLSCFGGIVPPVMGSIMGAIIPVIPTVGTIIGASLGSLARCPASAGIDANMNKITESKSVSETTITTTTTVSNIQSEKNKESNCVLESNPTTNNIPTNQNISEKDTNKNISTESQVSKGEAMSNSISVGYSKSKKSLGNNTSSNGKSTFCNAIIIDTPKVEQTTKSNNNTIGDTKFHIVNENNSESLSASESCLETKCEGNTISEITSLKSQIYSSVFGPQEIEKGSHLLIQVFCHKEKESPLVQQIAKEVNPDATRRDYTILSCKIQTGDKIEVLLNISSQQLLFSIKKEISWNDELSRTTFNYFVPDYISAKDLLCEVILHVNGVPVGEMIFITKIVNNPQVLPAALTTKQYKKVFISYAHQDVSRVKFMALAFDKQGIECFFDHYYLKGGDVFPEVISDFITNKADLFILCWSKNASSSEYVNKERKLALALAYPQIQPKEKARLSIYPINMPPKTELPEDMKGIYNFEEI